MCSLPGVVELDWGGHMICAMAESRNSTAGARKVARQHSPYAHLPRIITTPLTWPSGYQSKWQAWHKSSENVGSSQGIRTRTNKMSNINTTVCTFVYSLDVLSASAPNAKKMHLKQCLSNCLRSTSRITYTATFLRAAAETSVIFHWSTCR